MIETMSDEFEKAFVNKEDPNLFGAIIEKSSKDQNSVIFISFRTDEIYGTFEKAHLDSDWLEEWEEIDEEALMEAAEQLEIMLDDEFEMD